MGGTKLGTKSRTRVVKNCKNPSPASQTVQCYSFCPSDCYLDAWSSWSACNAQCNKPSPCGLLPAGKIIRTRAILRIPYLGGIKCGPIKQAKSCSKKDCACLYRFKATGVLKSAPVILKGPSFRRGKDLAFSDRTY